MKDLIVINPSNTNKRGKLSEKSKAMVQEGLRDNTIEAYKRDWIDFADFCKSENYPMLPASVNTVIEFVSFLAKDKGFKGTTISRKLTAIKWVHEVEGLDSPTNDKLLKLSVKGTKRNLDESDPYRQSLALTLDLILGITGKIPDTLRGERDKLIFFVGFAAALRRNEIKNLKIRDLEFIGNDVSLSIRNAKTSKDGLPQTVVILNGKLKIVDKIKVHINKFNLTGENHLFFGFDKGDTPNINKPLDSTVLNKIIKKWCSVFGLNRDEVSAHGLRRGYITEALNRSVSMARIQTHSRHRSPAMIMRYAESREKLKDHSGESFL